MMTRIARGKGDPSSTNTEQDAGLDDGKSSAAAAAARVRPASSRSWPGLKDPRIVRVSRSFGGKDRHSKVSTVRGLRDRRVRLSVQTAIQLYDLQDRLGLNQPSKVVDWLLDAAQHEIDKLPPLQVPPGSFALYQPAIEASHGVGLSHQLPSATAMASDVERVKVDNGGGSLALLTGSIWAGNRDHVEHQAPLLRDQGKDHGLFKRIEQHEQHHGVEVIVPVQDNLQRLSFFSMPSCSGGGGHPFSSYCILDASMGGYPVSQPEEVPHGYRPAVAAAAEQPSLSLSHGSQILFVPSGPAGAPPPMFSPYGAAPADHYDPKHLHSVLQMGSSAPSLGSKHHHF